MTDTPVSAAAVVDNSPLTVDSALSLMSVTQEDPNKAVAADPAAAGAADLVVADPNTAAAAEGVAADPNAQADPGNTNAEGGDQGVALPPIEAPASWKTEEKAVWDALPRAAQEAISRREQDNTKEVRNLQNSTAEQRKAADAEVTRLRGLTGQIENVLTEKVADLAREFPEIKTEADVVALSISDPARAQVFQAKLQALAAVNNTRQAALAETQRVADAQQTEHLAKAKDALLEAFPAWKEPEVARREVVELQDYAIKLGAPEAAARANLDPVIYKLTQKAMLYDRAQEAAKAAITRTPPRTVPAGVQTTDPKTTAKDETRRSQLGKLTQSGDIEDARGLLRA